MGEKTLRRTATEILGGDVYAADRELRVYMRTTAKAMGDMSVKEWIALDPSDRRWRVASELLKAPVPDPIINARLYYVGFSLDDFLPTGYNGDKLPETATAKFERMRLDKVA